MKHKLCDCDAMSRKRMDLLGLTYSRPDDYRSVASKYGSGRLKIRSEIPFLLKLKNNYIPVVQKTLK